MSKIPFSYGETKPVPEGATLLQMQLAVLDAKEAEMRALPEAERKRLQRANVRAYHKAQFRDYLVIGAMILGVIILGLALLCFGCGLYNAVMLMRVPDQHILTRITRIPLVFVSFPLFKLGFWTCTLPYPELRQERKTQERS